MEDPGRDDRLVAGLRSGAEGAFEELVIAYQHRIFAVALRMLGNAAEANDMRPGMGF